MSVVQTHDASDSIPNGSQGVKREYCPSMQVHGTFTNTDAGRRGSTILNPRSYFKNELWQQAPVLTGSTKFVPLQDAKNILVTGGAGFMYDLAHHLSEALNGCASSNRI